MATAVPAGRYWRIEFANPVLKKRSTIYTGLPTFENKRSNEKKADELRMRIGRLVDALAHEGRPDRESAAWLKSIGPDLRKKLIKQQLIEEEKDKPRTLAQLLTVFQSNQKGAVAESTYRKLLSVSALLRAKFNGGAKSLASFKLSDGKDFRTWMLKAEAKGLHGKNYAESHIRKTCCIAAQIFGYAVERGCLDVNPFDSVPKNVLANQRIEYVDLDRFQKVIDASPDDEFRALLGLCRYAGLRHPSETNLLYRRDVDLVAGRLKVTSPKTARQGKASRETPIVPELRPLLEKALANHEPDDPVLRIHQNENKRGMLAKVIEEAKVTPWKKLFQNLRASAETDFARKHPIAAVSAWLGNTPRVAIAHYLQVTEEDFLIATGTVASTVATPVSPDSASPTKNGDSGPKS